MMVSHTTIEMEAILQVSGCPGQLLMHTKVMLEFEGQPGWVQALHNLQFLKRQVAF